jgi:hypothetical protein
MMHAIRVFLLAGFFYAARAELAWSVQQQSFRPPPGVQVAEADYRFSNRGQRPVTITEIKPSCSCITATLDKKTYAAGESGVLHVRYNGAGQSGWQLKTIEVKTDEQAVAVTLLRVDAKIVEAFTLEPRLLRWVPEQAVTPQIATWRSHPELPVVIPKITVTPAGFKVELTPVAGDDHAFSIRVTPDNTKTPRRGLLKLQFTAPNAEPVTAQLFVTVE